MRRPILLPQYPLAYPYGAKKPQKVQVQKDQEKGSDVNLATYLLLDCFNDDYDEAVVLSNDSDLELAVELVASQLGKMVHVINPHRRRHLSKDLVKVATSHTEEINRSVLAACQFPATLSDHRGAFSKPVTW